MSKPLPSLVEKSMSVYGLILGPLYVDQHPDELAKNVFRLLSCLGVNCTSISQLEVNPKEGYARVSLFTKECEDYLVDVFNNAGMIMNLYDLRRLTERPERLKAKRFNNIDSSLSKNETEGTSEKSAIQNEREQASGKHKLARRDTEVTSKMPPRRTEVSPLSSKKEESVVNNIQTVATKFDEPQCAEASKQVENTISYFEEQTKSSSEDVSQKPSRVEAKTSTPFSVPCGCPDTIFYHQYQHIGTETRHAEFKRGAFIRKSQKDFRNTVGRYVCSFLNSEGGTLYFGVTDDGLVRGLEISKSLEEDLRQDIRFTMREMEPSVLASEYTVNFARVVSSDNTEGEVRHDPLETEKTKKNSSKRKAKDKANVKVHKNTSSEDEDQEDNAGDDASARRTKSRSLKVLELCVKPRAPPKPENMYLYKGVAYLRRDGSVETVFEE